MRHMTLPRFWQHYRQLPKEIQNLADKNFDLLTSQESRKEKATLVSACGRSVSRSGCGQT
jgi:hypothetical protein